MSKCGNKFAQEKLSEYFCPVQLGVSVSGGCEAAVHATRRFITNLSDGEVVAKLDFSNAFNTLRRDAMLQAVANKLPEIYPFCYSAYSCSSLLKFSDESVISSEGVQQGDPIGPLLFCLTLQPLLNSLTTSLKIGYLDDVTIGGPISSVNSDVLSVVSKGSDIGLQLNKSKCELIACDPVPPGLLISDFKLVRPEAASLLGAPLLPGTALDTALLDRCSELANCQSKLSLIAAHDALLLLKTSLSTPKLTHMLRSSPCSGHHTLRTIDDQLRSCVTRITNTDISDQQWAQASLPVKAGGLGVRLASHLAPSAFLASAAATSDLQTNILHGTFMSTCMFFDAALAVWSGLSAKPPPIGPVTRKQHEWDKLIVQTEFDKLLNNHTSDISRARLLAVSAPHSSDWLHALPISSCGLRLDDEAIRVAVGLRLGTTLCSAHKCVCGQPVDSYGTHGLSCKKSSARILRHNALNDIIFRGLQKASVPSVKEPAGLSRSDGKRPDGATQIPWALGKCLTWDVTVTDTLATSYVALSSISAGNAAERAAANKVVKYARLTEYDFVPIAFETLGPINVAGSNFLSSLGRRLNTTSGDSRESSFLFQRLSVCLQRYSSLALGCTFSEDRADDH